MNKPRESLPNINKCALRIETFKPANRACPTCTARWVAPGPMNEIVIQSCPPCSKIKRDRNGVRIY